MIKLICTLVFTFLTLLSPGQTKLDKGKDRINSVCDMVMKSFPAGNIHEAMQLLKQNSILPDVNIDTLEKSLTRQMDSILSQYGRILSYEFIKETKIKGFLARRLYILKFEKYYLTYELTIYNSASGWIISEFNSYFGLIKGLY